MKDLKSMENCCAKVFGAYDIRGVVGEELDSPMVRAIPSAYGDYLCSKEAGHFVIKHDARGEINLGVADRDEAILALESKYQNGQIGHLDGLSVDYDDWWFNVKGKGQGLIH